MTALPKISKSKEGSCPPLPLLPPSSRRHPWDLMHITCKTFFFLFVPPHDSFTKGRSKGPNSPRRLAFPAGHRPPLWPGDAHMQGYMKALKMHRREPVDSGTRWLLVLFAKGNSMLASSDIRFPLRAHL